ncbi:hypothetical protein [Actinomadura madurae]|uniref:hypothetical protein n=1 Tax=Actinomadura madurae TaxID=1993 RepID=UPI0020D235BE|nr:hypothetical protein [Actinomadura madurae]MCP9980082.1 hypothetical protein [Actinomadura madurae]
MILFERLDVAISGAADPAAVVGAVRRARRDPVNTTPVIATCEPRAYKRLLQEHPKLVQAFRVHRLPDFADLDNRMTLLHLLADERRVTIGASALEVARADLERLRGPATSSTRAWSRRTWTRPPSGTWSAREPPTTGSC